MKIQVILLLSTLIFTVVFCSSNLPAAENDIIVIENDWPPYYFGTSEGDLPGFAREILDICVPQAGYNPVYRFFPVKRMYSYLEKGRIDIALFSYRESREKIVAYGREPLFLSGYRPVVLKDAKITIESLQAFDSLRLGHLAGLKYSPDFLDYVEKRQAAGNLVIATDGRDPLKMLLQGMIDVFVDTRDTVLWRAKQMGVLAKIEVLDFDIKTSEYFVTISRQSPRLANPRLILDFLDDCIVDLKNSGQYGKIGQKYGIY